jgi:hypothetical protein
MSATACTATWLCALPPMFTSMLAPALNSVQQSGLLAELLHPFVNGRTAKAAIGTNFKPFIIAM